MAAHLMHKLMHKQPNESMCKTIDTEFGQIEYAIRGKGIPVVLFHGGHSNCEESLFLKGYDLSRYMLIIPSRPGYGNTPLGQYNTPKEAAILVDSLLSKLGIEKIIVVGISAGGLSAIAYAAQFPGKTQNLILISAVTKKWLNENDELYKKGTRIFSPKREKLSWKLFRSFFRLFPKKMTKVLFNELSTVKEPKITSEEIEELREMTFKQASGSGFITDLNQTIEEGTLNKVSCPTLILHSENDKSVPLEMANHAHMSIKNSILKTYRNKWGHLLWVGEESKYPIKDLNEFLLKYTCGENEVKKAGQNA